ncbi:MAG: acetyltransferase [Leptospiraceae bacterium]|nr:acetyltransferase [Leptospiraceae bacterium]MDW8305602.1 acetyltransferase [Leptospiraceae bacterium]
MKKNLVPLFVMVCLAGSLSARAARTTFPVVFAHGMAGFDDILGYAYWGDDYGVFVGDPCDEFLEVTCNNNIDTGQRAHQTATYPFQSSTVRGLDVANQIESYMATVGATQVNLVGHSQGGFDIRRAARILFERRGRQVVRVLISISSPHRGSPVAKHVLNLGAGVTSVINALARMFGNVVYRPGNDGFAAAKQLVYDDWPNDGIQTGAKLFNQQNPVDSRYAARYASLITAQNGLSVNPALYLVVEGFHNIDGDGYCVDDCDGDGAAGRGNGNRTDLDDDGLVGINSQQMGHRLRYNVCTLCFDSITTDTSLGYLGNLNAPSSSEMTSLASVINQDHLDVIGVPPDTFDEMEFYGALIDYIAYWD